MEDFTQKFSVLRIDGIMTVIAIIVIIFMGDMTNCNRDIKYSTLHTIMQKCSSKYSLSHQ